MKYIGFPRPSYPLWPIKKPYWVKHLIPLASNSSGFARGHKNGRRFELRSRPKCWPPRLSADVGAFWQRPFSGYRLKSGPCSAEVWLPIQNPQHAKSIALSRWFKNLLAITQAKPQAATQAITPSFRPRPSFTLVAIVESACLHCAVVDGISALRIGSCWYPELKD